MPNRSAPLDFADRLAAAVRRCGTPLCVGLDPREAMLPDSLSCAETNNLEAKAACYSAFCRSVIDVVAPLVPVVKPQAAFFEQLGPWGMQALAEVISHARRNELLVVLDGKRNDIGSTATAYAKGYLGKDSPWQADALTISPYLGEDSITPFVELAEAQGAGLFTLVKTSNPGGGQFQDLLADETPVYRHVAALVEKLAAETAGECGYGCVGAVIGATYPEQLAELRAAMPHTWFLVPGFGAQGGSVADVLPAYDSDGLGAIVNSSRAIIFAYRREPFATKFGDAQWQSAVEAATRDTIEQLKGNE